MIRVESLTKRFADAEAVRGISFTVAKGEIVGLLGPNGAGKTTTMRMLTCFVPPTSGTANVAGYDIYDQSIEVRRNIGYLPENVPLYGEMRVDEYLRYRARLKGVPRAEVGRRLDFVVGRCGLGDVRDRIIDHLSKGYRQRVGLAEALVHNPPILILDEPTVGLDPNQIRQVRSLIQDLGREHTIILSSHILPEVEQVCGRLIIIARGRIVAQDRTEVLRRDIGGTTRLEVEIRGDREAVLAGLRALDGASAVIEGPPGDRTGTDLLLPRGAEPLLPGTPELPARASGLSSLDAGEALPAAPPRSSGERGVVQATIESGPDVDLREGVYRLAVSRGWVLLGLARRRLSLEDIFIDLTTRDPGDRSAIGTGAETPPPESSADRDHEPEVPHARASAGDGGGGR